MPIREEGEPDLLVKQKACQRELEGRWGEGDPIEEGAAAEERAMGGGGVLSQLGSGAEEAGVDSEV